MTRLINADELKIDLKQYFTDGTLDSISAKMAFYMFLRKIDETPTVSEITKEKLSNAYDQGYEDGKNNWLQEERPQGDWGKWNVYEIRCPECLEYFNTDCYSKEELNKCPNCGADMREGGAYGKE